MIQAFDFLKRDSSARAIRLPFLIFFGRNFYSSTRHWREEPSAMALSQPRAVKNRVLPVIIESDRRRLKENVEAVFVLPEFVHIEFQWYPSIKPSRIRFLQPSKI